MEPFLILQNLEIIRNSVSLFEPLSAELRPMQWVWVRGPNGSGKSSLLSLLAHRDLEHKGKIHSCGSVFYLPQLQSPTFSIPLSLQEVSRIGQKGTPKEFDWLPRALWHKTWNDSSGGERMRALVAKALHSQAQVLLLDEIFNHIEKAAIGPLMLSIQEYLSVNHAAAILVSHVEPPLQTPGLELSQWQLIPPKGAHS